jgi:hypothetical protein
LTPSKPASDDVLTIAPPPPCFSIYVISAFMHSHTGAGTAEFKAAMRRQA